MGGGSCRLHHGKIELPSKKGGSGGVYIEFQSKGGGGGGGCSPPAPFPPGSSPEDNVFMQ